MNLIEMAFNEYHTRTCIRFRPRSNERDYIVLTNGQSGCWSSVGRIGGRQEVNFQTPGCMVKIGTVIHELMHACGFLHEQNRSERDNYVSINWPNVKSGKWPTEAAGLPWYSMLLITLATFRHRKQLREGQRLVDERVWRQLRLRQCYALLGECILA